MTPRNYIKNGSKTELMRHSGKFIFVLQMKLREFYRAGKEPWSLGEPSLCFVHQEGYDPETIAFLWSPGSLQYLVYLSVIHRRKKSH